MKAFMKKIKSILDKVKAIQAQKRKPDVNPTRHKCKNCGHVYWGSYCPQCGQKAQTERLTTKLAMKGFLGGLTNVASGFWYTIFQLFYKPGKTIENYIRGKRVNYFKPFSMLFILATVYAVGTQFKYGTLNESKIKTEEVTQTNQNESNIKNDNANSKSSHLEIIDDSDNKSIIVKLFKNIIKQRHELIEGNTFLSSLYKIISDAYSTNTALQIVLILPFFTCGLYWAFKVQRRKKHYNSIEILYAACFISCQMLIISIVLLPFSHSKEDLHTIIYFIVSYWTIKQLFGSSWSRSLGTFILAILYSFLLVLGISVILLTVFLGIEMLFV